MPPQRDLFDDTVMTFGEHLEELRVHLFKAIIGLIIAVTITMIFGESILRWIRQPIDDALRRMNILERVEDDVAGVDIGKYLWEQFFGKQIPKEHQHELKPADDEESLKTIEIEFSAYEVAQGLHGADPQSYPSPDESLKEKRLRLAAKSDTFLGLRKAARKIDQPVALNVQEAFMTYLKVSFVAGLIVSSPWVFFQIWLFVAAGLYPHERKYIYIYLPMSLGLFLGGAAFCFYAVFPTVLDFLLGFNLRMGITAQIRISEWISFAVMLPLMFGVSFQLPLVMVFLAKLGIFQVAQYREQRRVAILVIAILSMVLTPTPDPGSMIMMMIPLVGLYELGILFCAWNERQATQGVQQAN